MHCHSTFVRVLRKKFADIVGFAKIAIEKFSPLVYNKHNVAQVTVTVTAEGGGLPERRTQNHVHCKFYP